MIATFNALLDIARAEAGSERGGFEEVDLTRSGATSPISTGRSPRTSS